MGSRRMILFVRRREMKNYLSNILAASLAVGFALSAAAAEPLKVGVMKMAALTNPWVAKRRASSTRMASKSA